MTSVFQTSNAPLEYKSKTMENDHISKAMLEVLREILAALRGGQAVPVVDQKSFDIMKDLIDGVTVKSILDIERSTLYRLKKSNGIRTIRIGKKDYYSKKEVEGLVNRFIK